MYVGSLLAASTIRNLGQKEYEKRKQAALEVEHLVRDLREKREFDSINVLIAQLTNELFGPCC